MKEHFDKILEDERLRRVVIRKGQQPDLGTFEARHAANHLLEKITEEKADFLKPSLIYSLSSLVEGKLNACFIDFCYSKFGDEYKNFSKSFIKMSIHDKFNLIIPIISNYEFNLNHSNKNIIVIKKMISVRNQLIHIKSHYVTYLFSEYENNEMFEQNMNQDELGIYHDSNFEKLDINFLNDCFNAVHTFSKKFSDLSKKINYKNFKPEEWFITLESKKMKIVITKKK